MSDFRRWTYSTIIVATLAMPVTAIAQAPRPPIVNFDIPAGSLDYALTKVASQVGRRILFDPAVVRRRTTSGLKGLLAPEAAIRRLIAGTGLELRTDERGQWLIVAAVAIVPTSGQVLGTVRVRTGNEDLSHLGANGSSDPLATEGTKSYTTTAQGISSKRPLTLKETPQTVSVLTRQQIDDRALNSFDDALGALPGVTTTSAGGITGRNAGIYSRGFEITNVQIDGGSPLSIGSVTDNFTSNRRIVDDLSIYDSVEIERGAGGQFTGIGDPGGILSLVRKRPLDHAALDGIAQAGSWNRYRGVVDASSPVLLNGLIRARAVLTAENNDYFYDNAERRFRQGYVNIEVDPSPATTINVGAKFTHERSTPFKGLPTDKTGALIDFPRATCFCTSWSRATVDGKEFFAQLTQKLSKEWEVHLNGSVDLQKIDSHYFNYFISAFNVGGYDQTNNSGITTSVYDALRRSNQYLLDGYVAGKTELFGIKLDLTVGANYQKISQVAVRPDRLFFYDGATPLIPFSPARYFDPSDAQLVPGAITYPRYLQEQYGVYGTLRILPVDRIHLTIGERYTRYRNDIVSRFDYGDGQPFNAFSNNTYEVLSPPNVGLVVDVSKSVSAFANYASIFNRSNNFTKEGKLVDPTTGLNAEAGVKGAAYGGRLNLSGSIFYIKQINLPAYDYSADPSDNAATGASCCYVTDGSKNVSKGFDAQIQGALTKRLNADLSYTFNDFKYVPGTTNQSLPQRLTQPKHLVKLWSSWTPPVAGGRLMIGAGLHVESGVRAQFTTTAYVPKVGFRQFTYSTPRDGYVTANAMLKYNLTNKVNVQLNLENIFDRKYYQTVHTLEGNYYGQPRSFLLTLHGAI